jgi:hypothetical protein
MADFTLPDGSVLLKTSNNTTTSYGVSRADDSTTNPLAQISMFGSGTNNFQGALAISTINSGTFDGPLVERMRIHTNGNVGIGTPNPGYTLDVKGIGIKLGLEGNGGGQLILANNANDNKIYLEAFNKTGDGSADELLLTGMLGKNVPKLSLLADSTYLPGNVGIGTTGSITDKLHVEGGFVKTRIFPSDDKTPGLTGFSLESREKGGGTHTWRIYTAPPGGGWGVPSNSLTFWEYDNVGCSPGGICNPRLVLQANTGNIGIGTTGGSHKFNFSGKQLISFNEDTNPETTGKIIGGLGFYGYGVSHGQFHYRAGKGFEMLDVSADGPDINHASTNFAPLYAGDIRYYGSLSKVSSRDAKENIDQLSIQEAFEALEKLNPVKFNLKADEGKMMHLGFIAEDVTTLALSTDKKAIVNDHITAILTKVIKEQQKIIEALINNVKTLELKISGRGVTS